MAQFDLKKATVTLCDGRKATLEVGGSGNAGVDFTDASTHRGTQTPVSVTIVNAGISHGTLDVAVSGTDITITPITNGSSVITSTAAQIEAAVNAYAPAAALVVASLPGTGASAMVAAAKASLATGARTLALKIADGTVDYTEKVNRVYTKDRGLLSGIKNGDEEPMEVKFDAIWEFIKASTGSGSPTPLDVLKNRGEASAWVSTDPDPCNPFCVDVEILYAPACGAVQREWITLPLFRYEDIGHQAKEGRFNVSGKCNVTEATVLRAT